MPAEKTLLKLEVQHNQLEVIDDKMFYGFEKLLSIDLSHNNLIEVDSGAFLKCPRLTRIILSHNTLKNLWQNTFFDQVRYLIYIKKNILLYFFYRN